MLPKKATLITLLAICTILVASVATAQSKGRSPEQLVQEIMLQLEEIEHRIPKHQGLVFKVRNNVYELYSHAVSEPQLPETTPETSKKIEEGEDLYDSCTGLSNSGLKRALHRIVDKHVSVGYQRAQDLVFEDIDNHGGYVTCVYTGRKLKTNCEPNANNMNIEHTWPQSKGAVGIAKCDLHHLFPSDSKANGRRGNNPFGEVSYATWEEGGSKTDNDVFDVRPVQRGDTARAIFYFSIRYNKAISPSEEKVLKKWHKEDPVTKEEIKRCDRIENFQHNRNPFVDHPEFVNKIADF